MIVKIVDVDMANGKSSACIYLPAHEHYRSLDAKYFWPFLT